jgi:hypothetical protein
LDANFRVSAGSAQLIATGVSLDGELAVTFCSVEVNKKIGQGEKGYALLVLLLFVALLSMSFLVVVERIDFEIKRDREEEMIHRGVQYSRAVRNFINKFHRYPNSIEELENTDNLHFLRKRYKDPITGKDFRILHLTDMPSFISMPGPGVAAASLAQQQKGSVALSNFTPTSSDTSAGGAGELQSVGVNDQGGDSQDSRGIQSDAPQDDQNGFNVSTPLSPSSASPKAMQHGVSQTAGSIVIGVASASKEKTIREFNKKDHYNQWLFIYDPSTDHDGLLTTPSQPPLQTAIQRYPQRSYQELPRGSASNSAQTNAPAVASPVQAQR